MKPIAERLEARAEGHRDCPRMSKESHRLEANLLDDAAAIVRDLTAALAWALREIEDGAPGSPDGHDTPAHRCEFNTNPEKGACDFHDGYWCARSALDEAEGR